MDKLKRIKIEGFRSIRSLDLELGDVTVLIGANGSGKSNFIEFFRMIDAITHEDLQVYVGRQGGANLIVRYGSKVTDAINFDFTFLGESDIDVYGITLLSGSDNGLTISHETWGHVQSEGGSTKTEPIRSSKTVGGREARLPSVARQRSGTFSMRMAKPVFDRLMRIYVYHFHDTSEFARIRLAQDIDRNRELLSDGGNLPAFLYMLKETKPAHFERIVSTLRLVVPYLRNLILEPDRLNPNTIQLRWRDRNPNYEFGVHQLSDGSLRAIALVTALLQPEETLPGIIIIDEPELGLHPAAIGVIASLIREVSTKRQVIVATQSPRFLAEFTPEETVVVERVEDDKGYGESRFNRLSTQELADYLEDYDLGELYEKNVTGGWPR